MPIMGNTEDVVNSKSSTDTLSDAEKMNGYVSWYLNGVMNRAEYGDSKNNAYNAVNFSGPLQKLYPSSILEAQRTKTINGALENTNHNQIVACGTSNMGILGDILNIGTLSPTDCYKGNGSPADKPGATVLRLESWDGRLSLFNTAANTISEPARKIIDALSQKLPSVIRNTIEQSVAGYWNKKTPPLPWSNENGKPFSTDLLYRKAYNEWRGKTCVVMPVFNWLVCLDNIFVPNKYADLFPYVPLSTTEDVPGEVTIEGASQNVGSGVGDVNVKDINLSGDLSSKLSLPHLAETNELGELLQDTYTPADQKANRVGSPTNVSSQVSCSDVEVRSNAGDTIFADSMSGTLSYTASFSCTFDAPPPTSCYSICLSYGGDPNECRYECANHPETIPTPKPVQTQTCSKDVYIKLTTKTQVPLLDDIWSRLVAGPMSVFKRIFPKTNTEGSVGQIIDIPGSTNVTYSGANITKSDTDLKFPHVGGISEYFLKGIQTALRPKGMGNSLSFADVAGAPVSCTNPISFDGLNLQGATDTACKICGYNIPPTLQKIIESAAQKYGVPGPVILGTMYHEGAFSRGLEWTDENVRKWSVCGASVPGCNKDATDVAQIPFGWIPYFFYEDSRIWGASQSVDPARTKETSSPCNVLDGIYATAAALKMWSGGLSTSVKYPSSYPSGQNYSRFPDFCYNWDLNNGTNQPGSCSGWNENTVATSEVGYGGYCPEAGKHPIGSAFPDDNPFLTRIVSYYNQYSCH